MTSEGTAETVSLASNEEFTNYGEASIYHNTVDLRVARMSSTLPLSVAEEIIPRLNREIELLEAQLEVQHSSKAGLAPKQKPEQKLKHNVPK